MLVLVRGIPGAGKTTFAKEHFVENNGYKHVEADMFFDKKEGYEFRADLISYAHRYSLSQTALYLYHGFDVVVSNTFTTAGEIQPYVDIANKLGVKFDIVSLTTDFGSIHNVPDDVMESFRSRYQELNADDFERVVK